MGVLNIAYIDDTDSERELFGIHCDEYTKGEDREYDISLHSFADPEEFVNTVKKDNYDVIIIDLMMPTMSGWQIVKKVNMKMFKGVLLIKSAIIDDALKLNSALTSGFTCHDVVKAYKKMKSDIVRNRVEIELRLNELSRKGFFK